MSDSDFTVGDLRAQLAYLSDDTKLTFGGGFLTFYRAKLYGDEANIEFNEPQADLSPAFKKRNPHIKVAYVDIETTAWEDNGIVGTTNVSIR